MNMSSSPSPSSLIDKVVADRWRVVEQIGRGGFATIYRAVPAAGEGPPVALKVLEVASVRETFNKAPEAVGRMTEQEFIDDVRTRFVNEAHAAEVFRHRNIRAVHEHGTLPEDLGAAPFMAMEYLEGETFLEYLQRWRRLESEEAAFVISAVLEALAEMARRALVHRDIKPANVFIVDEPPAGEPPSAAIKLLDLGLSKMTAAKHDGATAPFQLSPHTVPGFQLGTFSYSAPEQLDESLAGTVGLDHRTDLYSTGLLLYEAVTGVQPFASLPDPLKRFASIRAGRFPPPGQLRADVPKALEQAILKAMAVRPDDRFASADDFREALRPWASKGRLRARRGAAPGGQPSAESPSPSGARRFLSWLRGK
jgi:serine/threonine-protein kinase